MIQGVPQLSENKAKDDPTEEAGEASCSRPGRLLEAPTEDRTPVRRKHDDTATDQAADNPNDTKHAGKDPKMLSEQPSKAKSSQKQSAEGGDVEDWGEDKDDDDYGNEDENASGDGEKKDHGEAEDEEGTGRRWKRSRVMKRRKRLVKTIDLPKK